MNKVIMIFFEVLKIGVLKINPRLSWTWFLHFRQEFVHVGFANRWQIGVVTLIDAFFLMQINEFPLQNKIIYF